MVISFFFFEVVVFGAPVLLGADVPPVVAVADVCAAYLALPHGCLRLLLAPPCGFFISDSIFSCDTDMIFA